MSIKPTPQTIKRKAADAKRQAEPDIVDRMVALITDARPDLIDEMMSIAEKLRQEVGGERVYVRRRRDLAAVIIEQFDGRNATQLARALGIGRTTVYRHLRK